MKDMFIKCDAQTPELPAAWERELERQFVRRFCAGLALCLLALLLFSFTSPHAPSGEAQETVPALADVSFSAPDFGDTAAARSLQTVDWRYDAAWAKEYPGLAIYRNGDNFITCGTLFTAYAGQEALEVLQQESGLAFTKSNTASSDPLQCYLAQLDDAAVQLYALTQDTPGEAPLVWAQVYIAAAPPADMKQAARSAEAFVRQALDVPVV